MHVRASGQNGRRLRDVSAASICATIASNWVAMAGPTACASLPIDVNAAPRSLTCDELRIALRRCFSPPGSALATNVSRSNRASFGTNPITVRRTSFSR